MPMIATGMKIRPLRIRPMVTVSAGKGSADEIVHGGPGREDDPRPERELRLGAEADADAGDFGDEIIEQAPSPSGASQSV